MGDFLEAAYKTLQNFCKPLTAEEITNHAMGMMYLTSNGATPSQTMKARLSDNIRLRGNESLFMRTGKGIFALRAWGDLYPEFVADRFEHALLEENAVVFDREHLPLVIPGPGLHSAPINDGIELLNLCRPMLRREAEEDPTVVQLVSAFIVKWEDQYLTYKRSARLPESRLHGEYSITFGGHLTPYDLFDCDEWPTDPGATLWNIFDPVNGIHLLQREFNEEVRVEKQPSFSYRGLLYDDSREVSRQHIAIVYDTVLHDPAYNIGERGFLLDPKYESLREIYARESDFENWSQLIIAAELREASSRGHKI
jgi:predicted NUDIX family phosphoesterase